MKTILIFLALLCSVHIQATGYYISVSGNDTTGNGNQTMPWRSLYKACKTVTLQGDTIYIGAGRYLETQTCTLAEGVSLLGKGKNETIIISHQQGTNFKKPLLFLHSEVTNTPGNQSVSGIGFDGDSLRAKICISIFNRGNVSVYNCDFKDFEFSPAAFFGMNNGESEKEPATFITGNTFYNNTVNNCSVQARFPQGLFFSGQDGFSVHDCILLGNSRGASEGDLISGHGNKRCKIYNSTIKRSTYHPPFWWFAMEIRWNFGEMEIYNCDITGTLDLTMNYSKGYEYSWKVYGNQIGQAVQDKSYTIGIALEADCQQVYVFNNKFRNLAWALSATCTTIGLNHLDGLHFYYNICENMGMTPSPGGAGVLLQGANSPSFRNIFIDNNTITADSTGAFAKQSGIVLPKAGTLSNIRIRNNIIQGFTNAPVFADVPKSDFLCDSLVLQNNLFYLNGNNNNYKGSQPASFTQEETIKLKPQFKSKTDFKLTRTSPAINSGLELGYQRDFSGNVLMDGKPDRGAYEYVP